MRILIAEAFRGPARAERARRFEEAVRGAVATLQNKEPEAPEFIIRAPQGANHASSKSVKENVLRTT